jgi:hypothetical protein
VALGVCLLFDEESDRALRRLWDRLEERGVATLRSHTHRRHRPHLSYVSLLRWDLDAVRDVVEALPDRGPIDLTFDAIATFRRGRAFLVPAAPASLVLRQQTVAENVAATGAVMHHHYQVGRWLPHCSVAPRTRLDQLSTMAAAAYDVLPLAVRISGAALIDNSTGESWLLTNVP